MTKILDGEKTAQKVFEELGPEIEAINKRLAPGKLRLDIVMVGNNPASMIFVKKKKEAGEKAGVKVEVHQFDKDITTSKLRKEVSRIGRDKKSHGIIVQLPLGQHINEQYILNAVPHEKDVDVLGNKASGKFYANDKNLPILPSTIAGIERLLAEYGIADFTGKNVVIVGAGRLVGKPAATYFMRKDKKCGAVSVITRHNDDPSYILEKADIIISGVGNPEFIKGESLKEGVIIIDAGTAEDKGGKLKGDFSFKSVESKASYITPVPGGVGPMTVAMIFHNLVQLTKNSLK